MHAKPGYRVYAFEREDANGKIVQVMVDESDLDKEDMKTLTKSLVEFFMYLPDHAQDMFLTWLQAKVNHAKTQLQAGHAMDQVAAEHGLIIPGAQPGERQTAAGIILPDNI